MVFYLRGLGAGRPDKGDAPTAAGGRPSVVAAAAASVIGKETLDARQLRELYHGAAEIKVCRRKYARLGSCVLLYRGKRRVFVMDCLIRPMLTVHHWMLK